MERWADRRNAAGIAGRNRYWRGFSRTRRPSTGTRRFRRGSLSVLLSGRSGPVLVQPRALPPDSSLGQMWAAMPYLFFGFMLGASLWYVARRLYGDAGGYIALSLYCFSPSMIMHTAGAQSFGEMGGTWGAFGIIFTAIAVAHTLYAPREVVLWNWRRILLLGLSLALAAGTQFSMAALALVALPLMLWVAPVRPRAVITIWLAAVAIGMMLLFAFYSFQPMLFWQALQHARWIDVKWHAFAMPASYSQILKMISSGSQPLMLLLPMALIVYGAWKRARYFGNTAPLLIAALFFILSDRFARFSWRRVSPGFDDVLVRLCRGRDRGSAGVAPGSLVQRRHVGIAERGGALERSAVGKAEVSAASSRWKISRVKIRLRLFRNPL